MIGLRIGELIQSADRCKASRDELLALIDAGTYARLGPTTVSDLGDGAVGRGSRYHRQAALLTSPDQASAVLCVCRPAVSCLLGTQIVKASVVEQQGVLCVLEPHIEDFTDKDGVIACLVGGCEGALQPCEGARHDGRSGDTAGRPFYGGELLEAARAAAVREVAGQGLLLRGEH